MSTFPKPPIDPTRAQIVSENLKIHQASPVPTKNMSTLTGQGPIPSQNPIQDPRYAISASFLHLLVTTPAESFGLLEQARPEDSPIFTCNRTDKVLDVWKGLIDLNILSVPVLDEQQRWCGFLDMVDIAEYVVQMFGKKPKSAPRTVELMNQVFQEIKFHELQVLDIMSMPRSQRHPFKPVVAGYSALSVVEILAREHAVHRVPILESENKKKVINLVTQSQVVQFVYANIEKLGNKRYKPLSECKQFFHPVLSVNKKERAIDAFRLMLLKEVSGLAVVDDEGRLFDNLSLRDMKLIATAKQDEQNPLEPLTQNETRDMPLQESSIPAEQQDAQSQQAAEQRHLMFMLLFQEVEKCLVRLALDSETAAMKDEVGMSTETGTLRVQHLRPMRAVAVRPEHTLQQVIAQLAEYRVHRVYIVDQENKPVGLVSLKDLLLELITV